MANVNNHNTNNIEEIIQLRTKMDNVDKELGHVRSRLDDRVNEVKEDLKNDIREVKSDLKDDLQVVKSDLQSIKSDIHDRISRLETRLRSNVTIAVAIGSIVTSAVVAMIVVFLN